MSNTSSALPKGERLAKVIARAGVCSRREAETLITQGRVEVNGKTIATPAFTVTGEDEVRVDGERLQRKEATRLWLFHKPVGVLTTHKDPEGRKTVFDILPRNLPRVISIGRLDIHSEGLLLLANDGALARHLELPATGWKRRYRVRVFGEIDKKRLEEIRQGVTIEGITYAPAEITEERTEALNKWFAVTVKEGKNREVRKLMEYAGLKVNRLIRTAYGPFQLGSLPVGEVKEIPPKVLKEQLGGWSA